MPGVQRFKGTAQPVWDSVPEVENLCQRWKISARDAHLYLQHTCEKGKGCGQQQHPQRSREVPATPRQNCRALIGVFTAAATVN